MVSNKDNSFVFFKDNKLLTTLFSVILSRELVDSSRINTLELESNALAKANRCFCPPDSEVPFSVTFGSKAF